jgi:hypothetical protein
MGRDVYSAIRQLGDHALGNGLACWASDFGNYPMPQTDKRLIETMSSRRYSF